ncbi:hypothetical protein [Chromobacterium violaceum]|uniref:hypothetical protein n=1 Tax=Chromobacterium violaceum TaxID=536 RepID=UPI0012D38182|nr:hypothetical protein [Chromobacterium violaceum]
MKKTLLSLLLGLLTVCHQAGAETIKTRYGVVSDEDRIELRLGKKTIYSDSDNVIYLQGGSSYALQDSDVVLVSSDCGGSGCVSLRFALITISKGGNVKKYDLGDFNPGTSATAKLENGQLRVTFSAEGRKQGTVLFDGDKVRKASEKRAKPKTKAALEDCHWLYKYADSCVDAGEQGRACQGKLSDDFPGWSSRGMAELQGSYKEAAFNQACRSFCQAKRKTLAFDAFSKRVCM